MQTYLAYSAALITSAFSLDLTTPQFRFRTSCIWAQAYEIPQESVRKIRTFEKYSRNFEPVEMALSNPEFGLPLRWDRNNEIYRGKRCCIPLTELPD